MKLYINKELKDLTLKLTEIIIPIKNYSMRAYLTKTKREKMDIIT